MTLRSFTNFGMHLKPGVLSTNTMNMTRMILKVQKIDLKEDGWRNKIKSVGLNMIKLKGKGYSL